LTRRLILASLLMLYLLYFMKRFLITPLCALLALFSLNSCQKEEKSALELVEELTSELQKVTNYQTAEAYASRVEVLNKRFQDASVRVFAFNGTPLLASSVRTGEYADSLVHLGKQIGRVRASKPVSSYAGSIDSDELLMAIGDNRSGAIGSLSSSAKKAEGEKMLKHALDTSCETPGDFQECYGSVKLRDALSYVADGSTIGLFSVGDDIVPVPAADEVIEVSDDEAALSDSDDSDIIEGSDSDSDSDMEESSGFDSDSDEMEEINIQI